MSNRAHTTTESFDFPKRPGAVQQRQPAVALMIIAVLAGATLICTALIVPILWTAITDTGRRPGLTYDQCGTMSDDTGRLICFDGVFRRIAKHSKKPDL